MKRTMLVRATDRAASTVEETMNAIVQDPDGTAPEKVRHLAEIAGPAHRSDQVGDRATPPAAPSPNATTTT